MTKKEFNEAMKFANNSRPDAAVGAKLASRETPFKKVDFPEPMFPSMQMICAIIINIATKYLDI